MRWERRVVVPAHSLASAQLICPRYSRCWVTTPRSHAIAVASLTPSVQVPEEVAPSCAPGSGDWWPEGWQQGRRLESEADIFALLGLPYRSPAQRCAF